MKKLPLQRAVADNFRASILRAFCCLFIVSSIEVDDYNGWRRG